MNADAVESILADFRAWLLEAKEVPPAPPADQFDVATIVQQFTALRQEVNLQTRASRAQLEQNAHTIAALEQALDSLQRPRDDDEHLRPLLKTLVDAHDALSLAEREVQRLQEATPGATKTPDVPPEIKLKLPTWTRWLGLDASIDAQLAPVRAWLATRNADPAAARFHQSLDALLAGYRMSLQRVERALDQYGLERIACVGAPFDPETMEVAEVVKYEGKTNTEVIEELRRGYRWNGKVFRFAQVRVARP